MATQLYLRSGAASMGRGQIHKWMGDLYGIGGFEASRTVDTTASTGTGTQVSMPSLAGSWPDGGAFATTLGSLQFITEPIAETSVTISGTISFQFYGNESSMSANNKFAARIRVLRADTMLCETISLSFDDVEMSTTKSSHTWTATPTSTTLYKGDRLIIEPGASNAGTGNGGYTISFWYDGSAANLAASNVNFTENFTFQTFSGAQTRYFNSASGGPDTSDVDLSLTTSRGAGVQTIVTNTYNKVAPEPASIAQCTQTAGGTAVTFWTEALAAGTLSGMVLVNVRGLESSTDYNATLACDIAVTDGDGSNAVAWGRGAARTELGTTETTVQFYLSGKDVSITAGQRLRVRLYVCGAESDEQLGMGAGGTVTAHYSGTTGGASGDSYIQFSNTFSPNVQASLLVPPRVNFINHLLVR